MLERASQGDDSARAEIWDRTYNELHVMARALRRGRFVGLRAGVPSATTIVHEAFMKCDSGDEPPAWESRAHFFGSAARAMGQFLIDWRRTSTRQKRGGERQTISLGDTAEQLPSFQPLSDPERARAEWTPRLAAAMEALERDAPQTASVVWLRYMLGLTLEQTSEILGIAPRTVSKHWNLGRAWLRRDLSTWGPE
ncbi:MAG: hypothetical protein RLY21_2633 [Planctomycetota bacterium]